MLIRILDDAQEVNPYEHLGELVVEADAETRVTLGVDEELVLPVSTTKGKKVYNVVPQGSCPLGSWTYKFYYEEALGHTPPEIPAVFVATLMYDDFEGWGLIMGELNFEMRFTVPRELAGTWDRLLNQPRRPKPRRRSP